jgi:uncharacterized RDD family membrane protein YckC
MEWYYAENNERRGPVSDAELDSLIRAGRVTPSTQVWRNGWENWAPLGERAMLVAASDGNGAAACVECRQTFPTSEMVQYQGSYVCPNCKPVFFQKVKEGVAAAPGMDYAGFWIRFVAKLLDGIIVGVPGWILQFGAMALIDPNDPANQNLALVLTCGGVLASFGLQAVYSIWMHGKWGATVGKMACGLRVVTATGGQLTYGTATARFFAELVSGLILYIGYIMAGFDEEKRTLHDRICNTRVIRSRA